MFFLPAGLPIQWSKNGFFAPQGWHVAPINVKFGTGERTAGPPCQTHSDDILHEVANLGLPPQAKFCKNRLTGYTPFGQIYTQNYKFQQFFAV